MNQNTSLHYESIGHGPPVIFLHGFSLDLRMWEPQIEAFAAQHTLIRYDLRGFGKSPLPTEEYSHVDDLAGLLDQVGLEQVSLVGLSRGGGVAINFVLAYPQRVDKLVLVDTVLDGHRWSQEQLASDDAVWAIAREAGVEAGKAAWLRHPIFATPMANPSVAAALTTMVSDYSGWHFLNRDLVTRVKPPASQRLHEITCPTLVVVGEKDLPDFQQIANTLVTAIPIARKVVLPNAGHLPNMEVVELFNAEVLGFINESR